MDIHFMSAFSLVHWWRPFALFLVSSLFLLFGIYVMVRTYHLENPLEFIMAFFSSSLIILISLVGMISPSVQVYLAWRKR